MWKLFIINFRPLNYYTIILNTHKVVQRCIEISKIYFMDETDKFILLTAAWFYDTGYLFGAPLNNAERSAEIMKGYLENKMNDTKIIDAVVGRIMATKIPYRPKTLPEKIICDADTYDLGTKVL
jgi:HD superfamily phosphodiesterase